MKPKIVHDIQPHDMPGDPFQIDLPAAPLRRVALAAARPFLELALHLRKFRTLYKRIDVTRGKGFAEAALDILQIQVNCTEADLARIPAHGPLIVAANHPHGAVDGLVLAAMLARVRADVRLVANHLVSRIPEMRELCFFVDPFDGRGATERSLAGLRAAHHWLRRGGALLIFPAGEVAHARDAEGFVTDARWKPTVGRLALATGAAIAPAFIEGGNSRLFYSAGRVHPALRTLLLPRELLLARGRRVAAHVGDVIRPSAPSVERGDATAVTRQVRCAVEHTGRQQRLDGLPQSKKASDELPIAVNRDTMDAEVRRLAADALLGEAGALQVLCAEAAHIPHLLREIGRLREIAYRAAGEGTGRDVDLDAFDHHYLHLFMWHRERREVVGAYRVAQTDRIVSRAGVEGLYTRTLFRYDRRLLDRLPPALELGRSFVRLEYQKTHGALLLLWKGICRFVARHPQYRILFGAVSISACYSDPSRQLLMTFLEQKHLDRSLAELVAATNQKTPAPRADPRIDVPHALEDVNAAVSQLEQDGKGVPVLLRQYLKLNARLLAFNVDPNFGDALDALMMVDLTRVPPVILRRYFGNTEAAAYLEHHRRNSPARAA